jgi:hypothetical protein
VPKPATGTTPAPAAGESDSTALSSKAGCIGIIAGVLLVLVLGVVVIANRDGDTVAGTVAGTGVVARTPGSQPAATPSDVATPPPGSSSPSSSAPAGPTAATSTIEQVAAIVCDQLPGGVGVGADVDPWGAALQQPCNAPPPDGWMVAAQPGPGDNVPVFAVWPIIGISHDGSGPDAVTGETGPSQATYQLVVFDGAPGGTIQVQSDCVGKMLTGRSPVMPGVVTNVTHPLFQFGTCDVQNVTYQNGGSTWSISPLLFGDHGSFEVTATPVDPGVPDVNGLTAPGPHAFDAAFTVLSVLQDAPFGAPCASVLVPVVPGDASHPVPMQASCATGPSAMQYTSGAGGSDITGSSGGFLNFLGAGPPFSGALDGHSLVPLFGQTIFPCGLGQVGLTACPDGATPLDAGGFVVVSTVLDSALPLQPDDSTVEVGLSSSGGPTYWVVAEGNAWVVQSDRSTAARAIIRGNSVTLVIPQTELLDVPLRYTLTVQRHGVLDTVPILAVDGVLKAPDLAANAPTTTITVVDDSTATSATVAPVASETPEQFFAALSASFASGDIEFALQRLHPLVTQAFSVDACRATLHGRIDPNYTIGVISVGASGPFTYSLPDGRSLDVPEALTVAITLPSSTSPVSAHIVLIDGEYRWFTMCT